METLLIMLENVILFVLLALPGYLLVKGNTLTQKESGAISKVLTYVGLPFMILNSTLNVKFTAEFARSMLLVAVVGVAFTFLMFFSTLLFAKKAKNEQNKGMMRFAMSFANNGFLGIPLANAVFGSASPVVTYLVILNIINNVMLFTLGIYVVSGDRRTIRLKKVLLSPVLIAFLAGVVLNLSGVSTLIPAVGRYSEYFSGIVTALSMTVLGMKLASVPFKKIFFEGSMYYISFLKLVFYPALAVALFFLLRLFLPIDSAMILGVFVAFATPTAGLATTFADQYGGDTEGAVVYTLGSTLLSIITIPVLYWLLGILLA